MKYIKENLSSYSVWSIYKFWEDSNLNLFLVKSELTVSQKSREHLTIEYRHFESQNNQDFNTGLLSVYCRSSASSYSPGHHRDQLRYFKEHSIRNHRKMRSGAGISLGHHLGLLEVKWASMTKWWVILPDSLNLSSIRPILLEVSVFALHIIELKASKLFEGRILPSVNQ